MSRMLIRLERASHGEAGTTELIYGCGGRGCGGMREGLYQDGSKRRGVEGGKRMRSRGQGLCLLEGRSGDPGVNNV